MKILAAIYLSVALFAQFGGLRDPSFLASLTPPAGEAAPSFEDPSDEPSLLAWWKTDDGCTNTSDSSSPTDEDDIKALKDQSGNDFHLLATSGNPEYEALATNALPALIIAGSTRFQTALDIPQTNATIFVAARTMPSAGSYNFLFDSTNNSYPCAIYKQNGNNYSIYRGSDVAGSALLYTEWYIFTGVFDSEGDEILRTNGVEMASGDAGANALNGFVLGQHRSSELPWTGLIGETVICTNVLTGDSLTRMEAYLSNRWMNYTTPLNEYILNGWFRADAGVTNTSDTSPPSNGQDVKGWKNYAWEDFPLYQGGGDNYPSYVASAQNSLPSISFAADEWLEQAYGSAQSGVTIFLAAKSPSTISAAQNYYDSTNSSEINTLYHQSDDDIAVYSGGSEITGGALLEDTWYILTAIWEDGGAEYIRTNGSQAATGDSGSSSMDGLYLGRNQAGDQDFLGQIGEMIVLTNAVSSTSVILTNIEGYLSDRWNITLP